MTDEERVWHGEELAVYEYLECGALGHSWDIVDSNHWTASFGEPFTVRCMRCMMERRDSVMRVSRTLLTRRYVQPPAYRFAKGERPKRLDFVLMSMDTVRRKRRTKPTTITSTVPTPAARKEVKDNGR
jgi:hypothetical protein